MTNSHSLTPLSEDDYDTIAGAVMETARGRWFLSEYARRNRQADTTQLLDAIGTLQNTVINERGSMQVERVRADLMEMATTISQLKIELASDNPEHNSFGQATEALDAVVQTTENATSSILEAAEQIQEMAWTLREGGAEGSICDMLDQRAADIYTACSFQDLTAQRTKKVVRTMRNIEGRINGLMDAWTTGDKPRQGNTAQASAPSMDMDAMQEGHMARHGQAPMRIGQSLLSHSDIDLVMRETETVLIEGGTYELGRQKPVKIATRPEDIIVEMVETAGIEPEQAGETLFWQEDEPAETPHGEPAVSGLDLADIDTLPTRQKIGMFS